MFSMQLHHNWFGHLNILAIILSAKNANFEFFIGNCILNLAINHNDCN